MARRHTSASRSRPAGSSNADDVFLENTLAFGSWAQKNRQTLILIGIAAAALLMGLLYYWNYRRDHMQQAALELERVEQAAAFGDTTTAKVELARYVESYGNTPYGDEARLLLGQLYLEGGQIEQAVAVLEGGADISEPVGIQVALLLAKAREQKGDLKEAEDLFMRVAARAELDFQVREALDEAARLRSLQGNLTGAIELYQRIIDDLERTAPQRGGYEMRLEELRIKTQEG